MLTIKKNLLYERPIWSRVAEADYIFDNPGLGCWIFQIIFPAVLRGEFSLDTKNYISASVDSHATSITKWIDSIERVNIPPLVSS